jgi:PAS domain S-box-containing protein
LSAPAASLDLMLDVAPDAMVVVDEQGEVLAVNRRAEELFRVGRDELLGRAVDELFARPWLRMRRTDGSSIELIALRGDGSEFPAEISVTRFEGPGGTLTAAAIRDGSRRAVREAGLREARERFRRVFEDGPVAMALVGDDFRLSEVNDAFCRLTGYSAQELARLTFTDITHPDDVDAGLRLARKVFAGELRSFSIDKRYLKKSGEVIWVGLTVSVIRDDAGRPIKGLGIVQDISERRAALDLAQGELERLARDHDRILEFAGEGIYHVDERGIVAFANPAAAELLGWSADELVGKPAHELFHHTRPDGRPYPREDCPIHGPNAAERGKPLSGDRFWRRDGTSFPVHYRSDTVPGPGRSGAVIVFSDESERERMEAALRDARERAARERLQAAEAERSRWARELHDETLQALAGLHMLLGSATRAGTREGLREQVAQAQEHIADEMEKLRGLISELRPAALDELGLEASVRDLAERTHAVYGLRVDTRLDLPAPQGPASEIDTAAYRIVQECLSNAARHADASLVVVELARRDGHLRIRVSDDGRGFQPGHAGEGFGLRGMRERVELLDGRLTIALREEGGTEVTATLPLGAGDAVGGQRQH